MHWHHSSFSPKVSDRESVCCCAVDWLMSTYPLPLSPLLIVSPQLYCDPSSHNSTDGETNCTPAFSLVTTFYFTEEKNPFELRINDLSIKASVTQLRKDTRGTFILFLSWQAKSVCVMLEAFICFYAGQRWWQIPGIFAEVWEKASVSL